MGASAKFSELDPWRKHEEARIAQWRQAKGDRTEPLPSEGMR
jgi:hypothetical protein